MEHFQNPSKVVNPPFYKEKSLIWGNRSEDQNIAIPFHFIPRKLTPLLILESQNMEHFQNPSKVVNPPFYKEKSLIWGNRSEDQNIAIPFHFIPRKLTPLLILESQNMEHFQNPSKVVNPPFYKETDLI